MATADNLSYRPDIDGLRAIAVLSVILFHVDRALLPGGFVGVDIFFVISGYLISKNILQDIDHDRFSALDFYRRRIKRIAPAMLMVVLLTTGVAQLILLPEDAQRVAESAIWSLLSLPNVYFWLYQDTSYFAAANHQLPLLHLWSLGVEEQFYLIWPLILLLAYRRLQARGLFILATLVVLASFGLGQVWFARDSLFVYYMLPTRVGELLLGAMVAYAVLRRVELHIPGHLASPMALVGLLMLLGSLTLINDTLVFPGFLAIPPTLGTALLILAGHCAPANPVSRLLTTPLLVGIGLVSYSAYLWHWPLLAFYRYGHAEINLMAGIVLVVATFILAWLSYRLIEIPGRGSTASAWPVIAWMYIVPATGIALLAMVSIQLKGYGVHWYTEDYMVRVAAVRERTKAAYEFDYVCQRKRVSIEDTQDPLCVVGAPTAAPPRVILYGDSNAAHYIGMLGVFAREAGFRFRNIEVGACPPLIDDPRPFIGANHSSDCSASTHTVKPALTAFDTIIISASWDVYQKKYDRFLEYFLSEAKALADAGKNVILIGKAPIITGYDRRCSEKALRYPFLQCTQHTAPPDADVLATNRRLKVFAQATPNVAYFDVSPYLCSDLECSAFGHNGQPLYFDRHHLSLAGSWTLGEAIVEREGVPAVFQRIPLVRN